MSTPLTPLADATVIPNNFNTTCRGSNWTNTVYWKRYFYSVIQAVNVRYWTGLSKFLFTKSGQDRTVIRVPEEGLPNSSEIRKRSCKGQHFLLRTTIRGLVNKTTLTRPHGVFLYLHSFVFQLPLVVGILLVVVLGPVSGGALPRSPALHSSK
jgi:hypothetical protein